MKSSLVPRCLALLVALHVVQAAIPDAGPDFPLFRTCVKKTPGLTVLFQETGGYQDLLVRTFNTRSGERRAFAIGTPTTAQQTSALVVCANLAKLPYVVRGGGHSYEAMSAIANGLVIDFSKFLEITVTGATAWVGAGQRLGQLYLTIFQKGGYLFPGGTCPAVGISGLILGGGAGANIRNTGWTSDFVISAEVVTTTGAIIKDVAATNPDLLWALRGGGANYGIVTRWRIKLVKAPQTVTVVKVQWQWASFVPLLKEVMAWKPWTLPSKFSLIEVFMGFNTITLNVYLWGSVAEMQTVQNAAGPNPFKVPGGQQQVLKAMGYQDFMVYFTNLYGQNPWTVANLGYNAQVMQEYTGGNGANANRNPFAAASTLLKAPLSDAGIQVLLGRLNQGTPNGWVQARFFGGPVLNAYALDSTAMPHRGIIGEMQIYSNVNQPKDAQWVTGTKTALAPYGNGLEYYNYFNCLDAKTGWGRYFGPHAAKLQTIKAKYDPAKKLNGMVCM